MWIEIHHKSRHQLQQAQIVYDTLSFCRVKILIQNIIHVFCVSYLSVYYSRTPTGEA